LHRYAVVIPMQWLSLLAAVLLLDASLTFENIWPTPAVTWHGALSIEFALCLAALLVASRDGRAPRRALSGALSGIWIVFALGRYAEVTAPALYGRDINLYWDLRFIPDVVKMVTRVAPLWLVVAADRKSTRLNSSHDQISYAVFCLKKKKTLSILRPKIMTPPVH